MKVKGEDLTPDEMSLLVAHSNMSEPAEPFGRPQPQADAVLDAALVHLGGDQKPRPVDVRDRPGRRHIGGDDRGDLWPQDGRPRQPLAHGPRRLRQQQRRTRRRRSAMTRPLPAEADVVRARSWAADFAARFPRRPWVSPARRAQPSTMRGGATVEPQEGSPLNRFRRPLRRLCARAPRERKVGLPQILRAFVRARSEVCVALAHQSRKVSGNSAKYFRKLRKSASPASEHVAEAARGSADLAPSPPKSGN
jgi:hypothetical protein